MSDTFFSEIKTVELFAGIGGFRCASDNLGIETVWANDFNAKASKVYRAVFGAGVHYEGDIRKLKHLVSAHDLLTGGFPCQPFSSMGKRQGIRDPRGTLFQEIVDILKTKCPKYFVLENVKNLLSIDGGSHFATILSSFTELNYHVEWRLLNAMDFEIPQNRERLFIVGIKQNDLLTNDIIIKLAHDDDLPFNTKRIFLDTKKWNKIVDHVDRFPKWGMACNDRFIGQDLKIFSQKKSKIVTVRDILQENVSDKFDLTKSTLKRLVANIPVNKIIQGIEIISTRKRTADCGKMGYIIFGIDGVAPTLTASASRHYERYKIGEQYRRLTNVEYARIQGFSDDHCDAVSIADQYTLFGNAVPPPMATWVIRQLERTVLPKS